MAGSRIKGITVEIGGDTTKLQTAFNKNLIVGIYDFCNRSLSKNNWSFNLFLMFLTFIS